jgi:hypothetical protein
LFDDDKNLVLIDNIFLSFYFVISFKYFSNSKIHQLLYLFINSLPIIEKFEISQTFSTSSFVFTQNQIHILHLKYFFKFLIYFSNFSQNSAFEPVVIF